MTSSKQCPLEPVESLLDSVPMGRRDFGIKLAAAFAGTAVGATVLHSQTAEAAALAISACRCPASVRLFNVTDYTSVAAAIGALTAAGGGTLYFPTGVHNISGHLTILNVPVRICGDGVGLSILRCAANSSLRVSQTPLLASNVTSVSDLSIFATGDFTALPYPALEIFYSQIGPFRGQLRCIIERVEIRGEDPVSMGFYGGINFVNCINTSVSQFNFIGRLMATQSSAPLSRYGIGCVATPGESPVEFHIENCKFYFVTSAVIGIGNHMEGIFINQSTAVLVSRFVDFTNSALQYPMLVVTNCHAAFQETGIYAVNFNQSFISGNLLYAISSGGTIPSPVGIFIGGGCDVSQVHNNTIANSGVALLNGIIIDASWVTAAHNIIDGSFTGVWLRQPSSNCSVIYNAFPRLGSTAVADGGTNNRIVL